MTQHCEFCELHEEGKYLIQVREKAIGGLFGPPKTRLKVIKVFVVNGTLYWAWCSIMSEEVYPMTDIPDGFIEVIGKINCGL